MLVVSGPPGAGKSTVASLLADRLSPSALVEGDEFFRFLRAGMIDPWLTAAQEQNEGITRIQASVAAQYRDSGYHTVFDGVLGPWFLDAFRASAGAFDYAVLLPPVETCLDRIQTRVGHRFGNDNAARSMHRQFVDAAIETRHVFDSDARTAADIADVIIDRREAGSLALSSRGV